MLRKNGRVALVFRQPKSDAERKKMLVAIEFPDDLFVAGFGGVELVELFPVFQRRMLAGNRLEMPVDLLSEIEILITEQIEPAVDDL